ncbi:Paired immunoglobulin-like type 2 receptor alpha [Tupaia chinensis]|nr:Paired immunoglobulin-like type 2 receptor alpha [Tupaia chinensis]
MKDRNVYFCRVSLNTLNNGKKERKEWQSIQGTRLTVMSAVKTTTRSPSSIASTAITATIEGKRNSGCGPLSLGTAIWLQMACLVLKVAFLGLMLFLRWKRGKEEADFVDQEETGVCIEEEEKERGGNRDFSTGRTKVGDGEDRQDPADPVSRSGLTVGLQKACCLGRDPEVSIHWRRHNFHGEIFFSSTPPFTHEDYRNRLTLNWTEGQNNGSLRISSLRLKDQNVYFCQVHVNTLNNGKKERKVWQSIQGTRLTVTPAVKTTTRSPSSIASTAITATIEGKRNSGCGPLSLGTAIWLQMACLVLKVAFLGLMLFLRDPFQNTEEKYENLENKGKSSSPSFPSPYLWPFLLSQCLLRWRCPLCLSSPHDPHDDGIVYASLALSSPTSLEPPRCYHPQVNLQEETDYRTRLPLNGTEGQNNGSLRISSLRLKDQNVYFCRVSLNTLNNGKKERQVWQSIQGTRLTVTPVVKTTTHSPSNVASTTADLRITEDKNSGSQPLSLETAVGVAVAITVLVIAVLGLMIFLRWKRRKDQLTTRTPFLFLLAGLCAPLFFSLGQHTDPRLNPKDDGIVYASLALSSPTSLEPPRCYHPQVNLQEETVYSVLKA